MTEEEFKTLRNNLESQYAGKDGILSIGSGKFSESGEVEKDYGIFVWYYKKPRQSIVDEIKDQAKPFRVELRSQARAY